MSGKSAEQQARDLLDRLEVEDAQTYSAGELVELANMIAELDGYRRARAVKVQTDCAHRDDDERQVVSEVVVWIETRNTPDGPETWETVRQVIACRHCGTFIEQRDVERRGRIS